MDSLLIFEIYTPQILGVKKTIDFIDMKQGMRQVHTSESQHVGKTGILELLQNLSYSKQSHHHRPTN